MHPIEERPVLRRVEVDELPGSGAISRWEKVFFHAWEEVNTMASCGAAVSCFARFFLPDKASNFVCCAANSRSARSSTGIKRAELPLTST